MSEVPETELPEGHSDPFRGRCAMLVSALAMVLAIAGLGGNDAQRKYCQRYLRPMPMRFTKLRISAKPNTNVD
jgi:hypothetical protein